MKEIRITAHTCQRDEMPELGNRFLIGNGYMGVRGTPEEAGREELAAVNLAGLYDRYGDGWREPLNAPNPFCLRLYVEDCPLALPESGFTAHTQELDIRRGLHRRETVFPQGVTLKVERFVHMERVHLLCLRATVTARRSVRCRLDAILDGDVWDIHGPHYRRMELHTGEEDATALATTNEGDDVAVCARYRTLGQWRCRVENRRAIRSQERSLETGQSIALEIVAAVYTSKDEAEPLEAAIRATEEAEGYDALKNSHMACWKALWERADIQIDGDEAAETALNYSVYHLLAIAPRHAASLSVPARGLSGQTYKGAVFWDTEIFMLDFYLAVLPEAARAILRYRIDTLPGAREKALQYGRRGAFYAWESQEGGYDACSDYNVTDVFTGRPMRTWFRDKQVHISAAVAYGLWKYADWTGDESLWLTGGAETLMECARFYHSLLVRRVESDQCELWDVIGPDEYHERVNNNAYTNEMARFVLEKAVETAAWMKAEHPQAYEELDARLGFSGELEGFRRAALTLKEQKPGPNGVIEQFDGYFALEDATVDDVRGRLKDPREYWGGAYGVAAGTQVIKQADVIALLCLLPRRYDPSTLKANYEYYLPRTEHGSSLSACMYALAACALDRPEEAYPLFLKSAQADWVGGGKQWAGLVYIGGTHPAAAGGAYMVLLRGFLGLRPEGTWTPRLPGGWKGVRCRIRLRGEERTLAWGTLREPSEGRGTSGLI